MENPLSLSASPSTPAESMGGSPDHGKPIVEASQTNYDWARMLHAPYYLRTEVTPESGGGTIQLSHGSTTTSRFKVSSLGIFNANRSDISGTLTHVAAQGALVNFTSANNVFIDRATWAKNTNSATLMDHLAVKQWSQTVRLFEMSLADYENHQLRDRCSPNRVDITSLDSIAINAAASASASVPFKEPRYQIHSTNGVAIVENFRIILGDLFPESIMAYDRDWYHPDGEQWFMSFNWCPYDNFGWGATTLNDASVGATAITNPAPQITNLRLNLAIQQNEDIRKKVIAEFQNLEMPYPYISYQEREISAGATNIAPSFEFSSADGAALSSIWWNIWEGVAQLNTGQDCYNTDGKKMTSFQTKLGGTDLQPGIVDCKTEGQNFEIMRPLLRRSPLGQSKEIYDRYMTWKERFDFKYPAGFGEEKGFDKNFVVGGIPLRQTINYTIKGTMPAGNNALLLRLWARTWRTVRCDGRTTLTG